MSRRESTWRWGRARWIGALVLLLLPACTLVPESGALPRRRCHHTAAKRASAGAIDAAGSPWLVSLREASSGRVCAGAILDGRHVLSARSCLAGTGHDLFAVPGADLVVVRLARPLRLGGALQAIELAGATEEDAGRLIVELTGVVLADDLIVATVIEAIVQELAREVELP
jgi:hypothetical protein